MPDLLISLATFVIVAMCSPGGATTLAAASGAQFGFARCISSMAEIAVGLGTCLVP